MDGKDTDPKVPAAMGRDPDEDVPDEVVVAQMPSPSAPAEDEVLAVGTLLSEEYPNPASSTIEPSAPLEEFDVRIPSATMPRDRDVLLPDDQDLVAEEAAAQAREQGVAVIREHVSSYLEQNPDANFVTWIATLHPENAEVTIDPRFLIPNNPWSTVFEEAKVALNGVTVVEFDSSSSSTSDVPHPQNKEDHPPLGSTGAPGRYYGGLIPLVVGFSMILCSVLVAFTLQLSSMFFYLLAVGNAHICKCFSDLNLCTVWLYALPWFLLHLFRFLDCILLFLDSFIVECLAATAYLICAPLAFSHQVGTYYHQKSRRLAHYVRWACRKPFDNMDPPRAWGTCGTGNEAPSATTATTTSSEYQLVTEEDEERSISC